MQRQVTQNLRTLAEQDQVGRPLARLQLIALEAADDPVWGSTVDHSAGERFQSDTPALHGTTMWIDGDATRRLIDRLHAELMSAVDHPDGPAIGEIDRLDPLELLQASVTWDTERLESLAMQAGADAAVLATLSHYAALPVLNAHRAHVAEHDSAHDWEHGYCPICGAWPLLIEMRGLERQEWSRCGRCAATWRSRHLECVYCGNADHTTLGYFAPEAERESRRATTCDNCQGYIKTFATVAPLSLPDVLHHDLASVELDVVAMDNGYGRPEGPGYRIDVDIEAKPTNGRRWLPWR